MLHQLTNCYCSCQIVGQKKQYLANIQKASLSFYSSSNPCLHLSVLLRCVVESAPLALPPLIRHCVLDGMEQRQTDDGRGRVRRQTGYTTSAVPCSRPWSLQTIQKERAVVVDTDESKTEYNGKGFHFRGENEIWRKLWTSFLSASSLIWYLIQKHWIYARSPEDYWP